MAEVIKERYIEHAPESDVVDTYASEPAGFKAAQFVNLVLGIVETVLALRFLFMLFGANPSASITSFVYRISDPFMAPFSSIFGRTSTDGAIFDWSVLAAMAIYALLAYLVIRIIEIASTNHQVAYR